MTRLDLLHTAVLFDLDSTLGDTRHRWHLAPPPGDGRDWTAYCLARMGDTPLAGTVTAARLHWPHHQIHVCSGSNDVSRAVTLAWLDRHRVPFDVLYQRPAGDHRTNAQLKVAYIRELRCRGVDTVLAYEDVAGVQAEIEAQTGVPVLGVNPFYPADAAVSQLHVTGAEGL